MRQISLTVNGKALVVEAEPEKPLLWVLREDLGLTGAKYGCGMAVCGCCVVHLNGDAIRSCVTPVARAEAPSCATRCPNTTYNMKSAQFAKANR
jgi:isoquinoline 1-oxidoreductase alpha subunit